MNSGVRSVALAGTLLSLLAVFQAALGSHLVDLKDLGDIWRTATLIHMFNAVALIGLAGLLAIRESMVLKWGAWLILLGTVIFCGSIYAHVIGGHLLRGVAPLGGLMMMAGWLLSTLTFLRKA